MVISSAKREPDKGEAGNRKFHAGSWHAAEKDSGGKESACVNLIESFLRWRVCPANAGTDCFDAKCCGEVTFAGADWPMKWTTDR